MARASWREIPPGTGTGSEPALIRTTSVAIFISSLLLVAAFIERRHRPTQEAPSSGAQNTEAAPAAVASSSARVSDAAPAAASPSAARAARPADAVQEGASHTALPDATTAHIHRYGLPHKRQLVIEDKRMSIQKRGGGVVATNDHIIRRPDEGGNCPSDGFGSADVRGETFTIHQQTCGGWYIINEDITFRLVPRDEGAFLQRLRLTYFDRREPQKKPDVYTFTARDFGKLDLAGVDIDPLYKLLFK
jgi:hypothetical protein